jgi:ADP-ribose pyrophosphatase YjhB (NUDIX family)
MKESSGIVVKVNGKCLICKRSSGNTYPNTWVIPMGRIENGETPRDAAYREFSEEMGVDLFGPITQFAKINWLDKNGNKKNMVYVFVYESNRKIIPDLSGAVDGYEHSECEYMNKNQISELDITGALKEVLLKILNK